LKPIVIKKQGVMQMGSTKQESKKEEELDVQKIMEVIAEVWRENCEHFGDTNPFEKDLPFRIIDKNQIFKGTIEKGKIKLEKEEKHNATD